MCGERITQHTYDNDNEKVHSRPLFITIVMMMMFILYVDLKHSSVTVINSISDIYLHETHINSQIVFQQANDDEFKLHLPTRITYSFT